MTDITFEALFSLPDLWQSLAAERRDILLYGMGNGADKILSVMAARGISAAGVFASDGFVRGQSFHGMRVMSFSEVKAIYPSGTCIVLLAFGSARPEVLTLIDGVAEQYDLYVPDVPVCGDTLFDAAFLHAHRAELSAARAIFDEPSRKLYDLALAYKLTGRYDLLRAAVSPAEQCRRVLSLDTVRYMADLGAYTGDTAREMLRIAPLAHIVAVEPDRRNFKKLTAWAETVTTCTVTCHRAAVLDHAGEAAFDSSGNRNAGLCTGREQNADAVPTVTVDELLSDLPVDYIKYDVEGSEAAALQGTAKTIRRARPRLKVSCYHRSEDLFVLPLLLAHLAPDYRFILNRLWCVPAWDMDLLAVPKTTVAQ